MEINEQKLQIIIYTSLIFFLGSSFNIIVLRVYSKFHRHYTSILLLMLLGVIDLINSLILAPLVAVTELELFAKSSFYCGLYYFLLYLFNSLPIPIISLIAYERCRTINRSISTNNSSLVNKFLNIKYDTKKALALIGAIVLIFCFPSVFLYRSYNDNVNIKKCRVIPETLTYNIVTVALLALFHLVSIIFYSKIYLIVRRSTIKTFKKSLCVFTNQKNEDGKNVTIVSVKNVTNSESRETKKRVPKLSRSQGVRKDWKVAKIFILVRDHFLVMKHH